MLPLLHIDLLFHSTAAPDREGEVCNCNSDSNECIRSSGMSYNSMRSIWNRMSYGDVRSSSNLHRNLQSSSNGRRKVRSSRNGMSNSVCGAAATESMIAVGSAAATGWLTKVGAVSATRIVSDSSRLSINNGKSGNSNNGSSESSVRSINNGKSDNSRRSGLDSVAYGYFWCRCNIMCGCALLPLLSCGIFLLQLLHAQLCCVVLFTPALTGVFFA